MKIVCLGINSEDNLSGVPKWEYSFAFAYLQAYYTTSKFYKQTEFINLIYYENIQVDSVIDDILANQADILSVSCYIWNIEKTLLIVDGIRKRDNAIKIILGGPEFSDNSGVVVEHSSVDIIVVGEGETTFKDILDLYNDENRTTELADIKGIIYKDESGQSTFTGKRENIVDLNTIPSPYLLGIVDLSKMENRLVAIETQRGCFSDCAYCNYQKGNKKLRFFDMDRVEKELALILKNRPKQLYLMDPTFNSNKKRAKDILTCIVKNNHKTTINAEMLPDTMDEDIIDLSKAAGMRTVEVGIQSLTPEAVKIMGRYRNEDRLFKNLDLAIKKDLYIIPQIIFGLPGDNFNSFLETFDTIYDLPTEELDILILLLLPQTRYRNEVEKYGIKFNKIAPYEIIESKNFSKNEIETLLQFKKIVLVTQPMKVIIGKIKRFASFSYHKMFLNYLKEFGTQCQNYCWPIHSLADKENAIQAIESFYEYFLNRITDLKDENLKNELYRCKRNAQFMLAARYMKLPK